ncbi:hypothetical protein LTR37_021281 [Vermiconidia calcicola]|uniref:Uncharacterized protein n=1 Tax=Vermiconidia calcicola TaxID=1690605 RepID=A0ACC3MBY6_9PEZI|nr:hypothetical protein LTR37_021281 [Vermiconidia calcicola]
MRLERLKPASPVRAQNQINNDCSIAARVFPVSELLGLILKYLEFDDLLKMYQTSHTTRDIIDDSPKALRKLYLEPDDSKTTFSSPFTGTKETLLGLSVKASALYHPVPSKGLRMRMDTQYDPANSIWRKMLICQPPIKAMEARLMLQEIHSPRSTRILYFHRDEWEEISSQTGITLGILDQWVERKAEENRLSSSNDTIETYVVEFRGTLAGMLPYKQEQKGSTISKEEQEGFIMILIGMHIAAVTIFAICQL